MRAHFFFFSREAHKKSEFNRCRKNPKSSVAEIQLSGETANYKVPESIPEWRAISKMKEKSRCHNKEARVGFFVSLKQNN